MSTYKGDSDGKRVARYSAWCSIRNWFGPCWNQKLFLVLASAFGGDISVLKGMGIQESQILACDIDAAAAEACKALHPDVKIVVKDVKSILLLDAAASLDVVFLDFCSWLTNNALGTLSMAASCIRSTGIVAITSQKARENRERTAFTNELASQLRVSKSLNRRQRRMLKSAALTSRSLTQEQQQIVAAQRHILTIAGKEIEESRSLLAASFLSLYLKNYARQAHLFFEAFYQGNRVPMLTQVFGLSQQHWEKQTLRVDGSRLALLSAARLADLNGDDPALCLNVKRGTLAAWRAHETMKMTAADRERQEIQREIERLRIENERLRGS